MGIQAVRPLLQTSGWASLQRVSPAPQAAVLQVAVAELQSASVAQGSPVFDHIVRAALQVWGCA
jgi:hypothetical protein